MFIISIGRNADNKIVINDPTERVSRYHAEIKVSPNGYMSIRDSSSNGTYVNGKDNRIPKNQDIGINRGDQIILANVHTLDWNQVPIPPDFSKYKHILSVGREKDNQILAPNDRVSRYHAMMLVDKNGKNFIYDQSSSGTLVNGVRIVSNVPVPVKRSDNVAFAGVERLDWGKVPKVGMSRRNFLTNGAIAAVGLPLLGYGGYELYQNINGEECEWQRTIDYRRKCVGMVIHSFKFRYSIANNPDREIGTIYRYIDGNGNLKYEFVGDGKAPPLKSSDLFNISGSGFFVNKEQVVTNKHVILPFDEIKKEINNQIDYDILKEQYEIKGHVTNSDIQEANVIASFITIKPVTIKMGIVPDDMPQHSILSIINKDEQWVSESPVEDFGVLTLEKPIPTTCKSFSKEDIVTEDEYMAMSENIELRMIGYPGGDKHFAPYEGEISAKTPSGKLQDKPKRYQLSYGITSTGGASGSPVIDKCGRLVAINYAHMHSSETYGKGIPAYLLWRVWDRYVYQTS